jgi:hypothetical protein
MRGWCRRWNNDLQDSSVEEIDRSWKEKKRRAVRRKSSYIAGNLYITGSKRKRATLNSLTRTDLEVGRLKQTKFRLRTGVGLLYLAVNNCAVVHQFQARGLCGNITASKMRLRAWKVRCYARLDGYETAGKEWVFAGLCSYDLIDRY